MDLPATPCRTATVCTFGGDRSRAFSRAFLTALDDERLRGGPGPGAVTCLLFTGHTGISTDGGTTVYGFNPNAGNSATWEVFDRLKSGGAFPGVVTDDTAAFTAARGRGLLVRHLNVLLPGSRFLEFEARLDAERAGSQYAYGFPNGDGDCNCTTWVERLGVPLLTGRMDEFLRLPGLTALPTRRFGRCV